MARRSDNGLHQILELWSRWCLDGTGGSSAPSIIAKLIDGKGHITFSTGGGSSGPSGCIEERIESAVMKLSESAPLTADVLRLEYAAGWFSVARRRQIKDYDPRGIGQSENAEALKISVRTYRRHLSKARESLQITLEKSTKKKAKPL